MDNQTEAKWTKTSESLPTHGRAVAIYPHHQGIEFGCWNNYHKCWDTPDGDDYMCDKDAVFCWYDIPDVPAELKKEYNGRK